MDARFDPAAHRYHAVDDSGTLDIDSAPSEAGSRRSIVHRALGTAGDIELGRHNIYNRKRLSWRDVWLYVHERLRGESDNRLRSNGDHVQLVEEKESRNCSSPSTYCAAKLGARIIILILAFMFVSLFLQPATY